MSKIEVSKHAQERLKERVGAVWTDEQWKWWLSRRGDIVPLPGDPSRGCQVIYRGGTTVYTLKRVRSTCTVVTVLPPARLPYSNRGTYGLEKLQWVKPRIVKHIYLPNFCYIEKGESKDPRIAYFVRQLRRHYRKMGISYSMKD